MPVVTVTDLNNAKIDVEHIDKLATSGEPTATDRKGNSKKTWSGIMAELNEAALTTEIVQARDTAVGAMSQAVDAASDAQAFSNTKPYLTKAAMDADVSQPIATRAAVTNDPDSEKNGFYSWNGSVWEKSGLQPASQSDVDTLEGLIKKGGVAGARVLSMTDSLGFEFGGIDNDGSFDTLGFRIEVTDPAEGFKVLDSLGFCLFDASEEAVSGGARNWALRRFLGVGDSIMQTADVDNGDFGTGFRANFPTYLRTMLEMADYKNYAKTGASFREYGGQLDWQKISHQVDRAIANGVAPDLIVVAAGTNDGVVSLGDYDVAMSKPDLASLDRTNTAEALRWAFWKIRQTWPDAKCFAGLPTQRADVESSVRQPLLDVITKMAHRYNFVIVDAHHESDIVKDFEVWGGAGRYLSDGLHPNAAGQIKMAQLYARVIKNIFNY